MGRLRDEFTRKSNFRVIDRGEAEIVQHMDDTRVEISIFDPAARPANHAAGWIYRVAGGSMAIYAARSPEMAEQKAERLRQDLATDPGTWGDPISVRERS